MAYTIKNTSIPTSAIDSDNNTNTVTQGLTVWVDGYPSTTVGIIVVTVIANSSGKTQDQLVSEVDANIAAYITANFPA